MWSISYNMSNILSVWMFWKSWEIGGSEEWPSFPISLHLFQRHNLQKLKWTKTVFLYKDKSISVKMIIFIKKFFYTIVFLKPISIHTNFEGIKFFLVFTWLSHSLLQGKMGENNLSLDLESLHNIVVIQSFSTVVDCLSAEDFHNFHLDWILCLVDLIHKG